MNVEQGYVIKTTQMRDQFDEQENVFAIGRNERDELSFELNIQLSLVDAVVENGRHRRQPHFVGQTQ